jgi:hypothetical protein
MFRPKKRLGCYSRSTDNETSFLSARSRQETFSANHRDEAHGTSAIPNVPQGLQFSLELESFQRLSCSSISDAANLTVNFWV